MTTDWIADSATIYLTDYAGLQLFVWQVPPGRPEPAGNWQWSAWNGMHELHLSRLSHDDIASAQDAAMAWADERRYCCA